MKKITRITTKYLKNHPLLNDIVQNALILLVCLLSATIMAFGFKAFVSPAVEGMASFVSGGVSGVSQILVVIFEIFGSNNFDESTKDIIYSVAYFTLNIPIMILSFKGIGARFAIFSAIHVLTLSLLINFVNVDFVNDISAFIGATVKQADGTYVQAGLLTRALFAGVCTGLGSAMAFKFDFSTGGADAVAFYFALRKSVNVGKYSMSINACVIVLFTIFSYINLTTNDSTLVNEMEAAAQMVGLAFITLVFFFVCSFMIDIINTRNSKCQLQIITSATNLKEILLSNIPHGATIVQAKGAFSNEDRIMIYMVISSFEMKYVVNLIREVDPSSFVNVTMLKQVYGKFFIKPIK